MEISWENLTDSEVNHYSVRIKSGRTNTDIIETSNTTMYGPLSADILEIRVSGVNQCEREGPSQTLQWKTERNKCCMFNMEPVACDTISM